MRDAFFLFVSLCLLVPGLAIPVVAALGAIWTELVIPQEVSHSFMSGLRLNLIFSMLTILSYIFSPRKFIPQSRTLIYLLILWGIWVTCTTFWAVFPSYAWEKWTWSIKVIFLSVLLPFIFRERIHIEIFLLFVIFSTGVIFLGGGVKVLAGGGGYGIDFSLTGRSNTGLSEGSTLALFCVMLLPLIVFFIKNSLIFRNNVFSYILFICLFICALLTVIGTHSRTGLISLVVYAIVVAVTYRRIMHLLCFSAIVVVAFQFAPAEWQGRMATIEKFEQDTSAMSRLDVWRWTIDFAKDHPFGGGFDSFRANAINTAILDEESGEYKIAVLKKTRAFHSVYFEIIGEQGYIGIAIYGMIFARMLVELVRLKRYARGRKDLAWMSSLCTSLITSLTVFGVGASFVGIAMQPYFYYFVVVTIVLSNLKHQNMEEHEEQVARIRSYSISRRRTKPKGRVYGGGLVRDQGATSPLSAPRLQTLSGADDG